MFCGGGARVLAEERMNRVRASEGQRHSQSTYRLYGRRGDVLRLKVEGIAGRRTASDVDGRRVGWRRRQVVHGGGRVQEAASAASAAVEVRVGAKHTRDGRRGSELGQRRRRRRRRRCRVEDRRRAASEQRSGVGVVDLAAVVASLKAEQIVDAAGAVTVRLGLKDGGRWTWRTRLARAVGWREGHGDGGRFSAGRHVPWGQAEGAARGKGGGWRSRNGLWSRCDCAKPRKGHSELTVAL